MAKIAEFFVKEDNGKLARGRYEFIDFLKGIMIAGVVLYHFLWDLSDLAGIESVHGFLGTTAAFYMQQIICGTFIFCSGICCHFSRNNIKNGARILAWGMVITVVTFIAELIANQIGMGGIYIYFGILHFIGCACLITGLLQKFLDKFPSWLGSPLGLILYLLTRGVYSVSSDSAGKILHYGYIGLTFGYGEAHRIRFFDLPAQLYQYVGMECLGFPSADFTSSDYFPIIPWIFLFLCGYYSWNLIKNTKWFARISHISVKPINAAGRNTIWIYLLHQPVLALITLIIAAVCGKL